MTCAFVHEVTLERTSQDREQAAEGGKEYWGKLRQVHVAYERVLPIPLERVGCFFTKLHNLSALGLPTAWTPFCPGSAPQAPADPGDRQRGCLQSAGNVPLAELAHGDVVTHQGELLTNSLYDLCVPLSMYVPFQFKSSTGTSQEVQWLRLHLPVQSMQV